MTSENILLVLNRRVLEAFPKLPPPGFLELTEHTCEECDIVRDDFHNVEWWNATGDLIFNNFGQLPLFTPKAYQYYLPAYILRALANFDSFDSVLEFLIYSWSPCGNSNSKQFLAERKSMLDEIQLSVVREVLRTILADEEMYTHHEDAQRALNFYA